jgi:hypothetical protein
MIDFTLSCDMGSIFDADLLQPREIGQRERHRLFDEAADRKPVRAGIDVRSVEMTADVEAICRCNARRKRGTY